MEAVRQLRRFWRRDVATSCQVQAMVKLLEELGFTTYARLASGTQFKEIKDQVYEITVYWS
jgi:hypothetical protein